MFYRAKVDLFFLTEAEARKAIEKALAQLPFSININPGQLNQEIGFISVSKCFHDEDITRPCEVIENWITM